MNLQKTTSANSGSEKSMLKDSHFPFCSTVRADLYLQVEEATPHGGGEPGGASPLIIRKCM